MGAFVPTLPIGTLNVALSNFIKAFRNNAFVGDLLAPRVPVEQQSFQYIVFDRSNQRLDRQTLRAPGGDPQEDRMSYSALPYFCNSRALRARIPYESEARSELVGFSLKQAAARRLVDKISLDRENYIAGLVTNPANVPNSQTLSGPSMWDSYLSGGTSHPIQVVDAARAEVRQSGVEANILILSDPVITALKTHPDIIDRFKYTAGGPIDLDQLSAVFGIKCIRAAAVVLDKNNVGSYVWGVSAVLAYSQQASSQMDLSALKTFEWTVGPFTVGGYGVMEYPDPYQDRKADIVSVDWYWDIKITAPETLYLFAGCVSAPAFGAVPAPVVG